MTIDITTVVEAVIALLAAIITAVIVPLVKNKTTAEQQAVLLAWVRIAVSAAEQIFAGSGKGKAKKEYVLAWLKQHNIKLDTTKIDALIESAVHELNKDKEVQKNDDIDDSAGVRR